MSIGQNINLARKNKNMSQEQLANALEVSRQCVSLWETDQTIPTMDNLNAICDLLDVSLDILAGRKPFEEPVDEQKVYEAQEKEREEAYKRKLQLASEKTGRWGLIIGIASMFTALIPVFGILCAMTTIAVSWSARQTGDRKYYPYAMTLGIVLVIVGIAYMISYYSFKNYGI